MITKCCTGQLSTETTKWFPVYVIQHRRVKYLSYTFYFNFSTWLPILSIFNQNLIVSTFKYVEIAVKFCSVRNLKKKKKSILAFIRVNIVYKISVQTPMYQSVIFAINSGIHPLCIYYPFVIWWYFLSVSLWSALIYSWFF